MPVPIDTVYQRVLTLANKEQRGYITPQEFNLLANQAQMEIFEQYFYDIKTYTVLPGNTEEYSDPLNVLYEKISEFETTQDDAWMNVNMPVGAGGLVIPWNLIYKIGTVFVNRNKVDILKSKDFDLAMQSPLTRPTVSRPLGRLVNNGAGASILITESLDNNNDPELITPGTGNNLSINYIRRPIRVEWAYVVINEKPLYNDNIAVDFELHSSEETELVYRILKLAGINLKAADIVQVGQTLEQTQIQQEK